MQVHFGVELLRAEWRASVACIGTFDGVHLGHQAVISEAVAQARMREAPSVLVTFDRHPASTLHPDRRPKSIAPLSRNLQEFARLGIALAVVLPFNRELSETTAQDFFDGILVGSIRATAIAIGEDFAFGRGREGTPGWLRERIDTIVVPPVLIEGRRVSSTSVRAAVSEGDVAGAASLLGRPFEVQGVVVPGQRLGRTIGFPTINLARAGDQVTPADGVYAGICRCSRGSYRAAISIGVRPAVGGGARTIEAYLIDYPGDPLYGEHVGLELHDRIRQEQHFDTLEALKEQIGLDVERAARTVVI